MSLGLSHSAVVVLFAGIAFLVYGLSRSSEALQKLAANQIRKVLSRLSESGIASVLVGVGLTLLMQSSGAVTATLVNLGTARVLSLPQVMGVLIGTAIGASLTIQLLSLHVTEWGLPMFIGGFAIFFTAKRQRARDVFEFVMTVGLLFFGLELIGMGARELVSMDAFSSSLDFIRQRPVLALVVSALVTTLFHSSTATLGIVIALAGSGVLTVADSMFWIYGANIGTSSTGLVVSIRGDYVGKRIAWANSFYRVATVALFFPFASVTQAILDQWLDSPAIQIAFMYMVMNIFSASIFFPLRKFGIRIIESLVQPAANEREFAVRFLKRSTYESFSIALAHAKREILEMGDIVFQMVESSFEVLRNQNPDLRKEIRNFDDKVDLLLKEIKLFLIRVSEMAPEGLNQAVIDLVSFGSDLEAAADIVDHHILELARKKQAKQMEFGGEEWRDLEELHQNVIRALSLALTGFQTDDQEIAGELIDLKHEIRDQENRFREAHIGRLSKGTQPGIGTSAIYLETLSTYLQLVEIISKHARRLRIVNSTHPESGPTTSTQ